MIALDATFNLRSKRGKRSVKAREFFQGPFTTALEEDELLTEIILPPLASGAGSIYLSHDHAGIGICHRGGRCGSGPKAEDCQPCGGGTYRSR